MLKLTSDVILDIYSKSTLKIKLLIILWDTRLVWTNLFTTMLYLKKYYKNEVQS